MFGRATIRLGIGPHSSLFYFIYWISSRGPVAATNMLHNWVCTLNGCNTESRVHERYRQTTDRQTDGRQHIANVNVISRSLKLLSRVTKYITLRTKTSNPGVDILVCLFVLRPATAYQHYFEPWWLYFNEYVILSKGLSVELRSSSSGPKFVSSAYLLWCKQAYTAICAFAARKNTGNLQYR